ncbi:MAG: dihydrodipicolinate synthase family protein [Pirellulaceae bacterium]|nr:dihydrodipicolinate synthase family protein [Pirellulaceae bacterium]
MTFKRHIGLFAAAYTPFNSTGEVRTEPIAFMVDWLLKRQVSGFYVCGSTGEGMSLTSAERRLVAETYVKAVANRVPVFVQVGHNSLREARQLAEHAQQIGASAVSATCPSYFKVTSVNMLVRSMAEVAAGAPNLPFYYYHIPALTGAKLDMVEFLGQAGKQIPNLAGIKFTSTEVHELQQCIEFEQGKYEMMWGCDEMLLSALVVGCKAAIGSTYNIASPLYARIISAFERGDISAAVQLQSQAVHMVRMIYDYPFHAAMKTILNRMGFDLGDCRLPQAALNESQSAELKRRIDSMPLFG